MYKNIVNIFFISPQKFKKPINYKFFEKKFFFNSTIRVNMLFKLMGLVYNFFYATPKKHFVSIFKKLNKGVILTLYSLTYCRPTDLKSQLIKNYLYSYYRSSVGLLLSIFC